MDLQEDPAPYRTMIEVIVKSLTNSANRRTPNTTHVSMVTNVSSFKEGVANSTSRERDEPAYRTSDSAIPTLTGGEKNTANIIEKIAELRGVDPLVSADGAGTLSRDGKPITKYLTSNPISHNFSRPHTMATASHHLGKKLTYPHAEPSLLEEGTIHESTVEPKRHSAASKQKDSTNIIVSVKSQRDVPSRHGGVGSSVIRVASGSIAGPRLTSIAPPPGRRVLKSEHGSLATREQPLACTLMPDNKAGLAKMKLYEENSSMHTSAVSHRNKEVTIGKGETSGWHSTQSLNGMVR